MMRKWIVIVSYTIVLTFFVIYKNQLLIWINNGQQNDFVIPYLLATFFALFPVLPYGIVAGIMGAKFGLFLGAIINIVASVSAAVIMFIVIRFSFLSEGRKFLSRNNRLGHFTRIFEQNAFIAILIARIIPIIPAQAVNVYSAISNIPFKLYLLATLLGKVPVMLAFSIVGDQLMNNPSDMILTLLIYCVFLFIVTICYRIWTKRST